MKSKFDKDNESGHNNPTMERTHIHLSKKQREKLEVIRNDTGLSVAEHIRRAIDEYLSKHGKS